MRLLRKLMQDSGPCTGRGIFDIFLAKKTLCNPLILCHFDYAYSS